MYPVEFTEDMGNSPDWEAGNRVRGRSSHLLTAHWEPAMGNLQQPRERSWLVTRCKSGQESNRKSRCKGSALTIAVGTHSSPAQRLRESPRSQRVSLGRGEAVSTWVSSARKQHRAIWVPQLLKEGPCWAHVHFLK